jgi:hypothetical protein
MSGSGGGGGDGWGPEASCERLVINTMLASPRPGAVSVLYPGQVLHVRLYSGSVVVFDDHDELVGGIASPLVQRLRECIEAGTEYQAKVVAKNNALVRLQVSAVSDSL